MVSRKNISILTAQNLGVLTAYMGVGPTPEPVLNQGVGLGKRMSLLFWFINLHMQYTM